VTVEALPLRDYQEEALAALVAHWRAGTRRMACVLPTGAGKTVIFAHLIRMVAAAGGRSLVLAHRDGLLEQAKAKIHDVAPGLRVGIVKGARREIHGYDAIVASVQSLRREAARAEVARARPMLVIIDEAHHAVAETYVAVLRDMGCFDDRGTLAAGFTATLTRADRVALGQVWENAFAPIDILELIRRGWLVNAKGLRVQIEGLDLRRVARTGGDWQGGALGQAMTDCLAPEAIGRAYVEHAKDRQGIVFMPSVEIAHLQAAALCDAGVPAIAVDGTTRPDDRHAALDRFRRGDCQALVNCGVFTEGTDLPMASFVGIARPTSSTGLYIQMAGRGLRPWPGKRDALIADFVGVTGRMKIATLVDLAGGNRTEDLSEAEKLELAELGAQLGLGLEELAGADLDGLRGGFEPEFVDGKLIATEVDLFESSRQQWLRTHRGVWFLAAGDFVVALAPLADGRFNVTEMPVNKAGGRWLAEDIDFEYALSWGEKRVTEIEMGLSYRTHKKAGWRNEEPRDKQLTMARSLGAAAGPDWTRGRVSDAISIELASRRLDHLKMFASVKP
jgi:ATP-dependent helicase IRC3